MDEEVKDLNFTKYKIIAIASGVVALIFFLVVTFEIGANYLFESKLGATGDYFGGILNPIFGLFGMATLIHTKNTKLF